MKLITEITNEPKQKHTLILENGQEVIFRLNFKPTQQSWFFNIENSKVINEGKLVLSANILRRQKNLIDFGISVFSEDKIDPFKLNDFSGGRVQIYLLNESEVEQIEQDFFE